MRRAHRAQCVVVRVRGKYGVVIFGVGGGCVEGAVGEGRVKRGGKECLERTEDADTSSLQQGRLAPLVNHMRILYHGITSRDAQWEGGVRMVELKNLLV